MKRRKRKRESFQPEVSDSFFQINKELHYVSSFLLPEHAFLENGRKTNEHDIQVCSWGTFTDAVHSGLPPRSALLHALGPRPRRQTSNELHPISCLVLQRETLTRHKKIKDFRPLSPPLFPWQATCWSCESSMKPTLCGPAPPELQLQLFLGFGNCPLPRRLRGGIDSHCYYPELLSQPC